MTHVLELPDLREGYLELCDEVLRYGHKAEPRGQLTSELENATFTVEDLTDTLPVGIDRGVNLQFAALEALQLIGGVSTPSLLCAVRPEFERYLEPNARQWGAYGNRVGVQASQVVHKLKEDRDSRQALVTLWNPLLDNDPGHQDYPCTVALGFRVRHDRLNLSVTMRSNDVWLGVAYDPWQFTQLQWSVARVLGIEPGTYTHTAWSLHLYERDWEKVERLHRPKADEHPVVRGTDRSFAQWLLSSHYVAQQHLERDDPSDAWYAQQTVRAWAQWREHHGF